jgi:hypothetical protein
VSLAGRVLGGGVFGVTRPDGGGVGVLGRLGGGVTGVIRPDGGGVGVLGLLGGGVEGVTRPDGGGVTDLGLCGGGVLGVARPEAGGVGVPTLRTCGGWSKAIWAWAMSSGAGIAPAAIMSPMFGSWPSSASSSSASQMSWAPSSSGAGSAPAATICAIFWSGSL